MAFTRLRCSPVALFSITLVLFMFGVPLAPAQENGELPRLNLLDQLAPQGFAGVGDEGDLQLVGEYRVASGSRDGEIAISATVSPGWHVYSITQLPDGPQKSEIEVAPSDEFRVIGPFTADSQPNVKHYEFFSVPVEEHDGTVVWSAPIRVAESADPWKLPIEVTFNGQICQEDGVCIPILNRNVPVFYAGELPHTLPGAFRREGQHVAIDGELSSRVVPAGGRVQLRLTAAPDEGYHVYAYARTDPEKLSKPTLIVVTSPPAWIAGAPTASAQPQSEETGLDVDPVLYYFDRPVTWTVDIQVPQDARVGEHQLAGVIGFHTCSDSACDPPAAARFSALVTVVPPDSTSAEATQTEPLAFQPASYTDVARIAERAAGYPSVVSDAESAAGPATEGGSPAPASETAPTAAAFDLDSLQVDDGNEQQLSFGLALLVAFIGGFILNFMPCVLPVIGLKVMSFVQQAGENRGRVLALNIWYSIGMISIFLVLATMAAVWNWGWGEQFNFDTFNIVMVSVVFTMGLSFLGVWEIPIPGFVGSGKASEVAAREGPLGALAKGAVTTILATPCSGPGLATALAWCTGKPPWLVYTIFLVMGLGMASPYLVIGANPGLIRFIPKPGAWMDTFKQLMGFLLLGTVVYIFTFIQWQNLVPTLALLFGLWGACWWIGRVPYTASKQAKIRAWAAAAIFALLIGAFAFSTQFGIGDYSTYGLRGIMAYRLNAAVDARLQEVQSDSSGPQLVAQVDERQNDHELPWQPFTTDKLTSLIQEEKTVLVDFTAKWCVTCKYLEQTVLNTRDVRQVVDANGIVTLVADWSDRGSEIGKLMESLGSKQVPVLAIFPAGRPNNPIVLRGGYTKGTLIEKLREAGPSAGAAGSDAEVALANPAGASR